MVERRRERGPKRSGGPGVGAILGIVAVAAVAIVAGRMIAAGRGSAAGEEPAAQAAPDPFGDWPREEAPRPRSASAAGGEFWPRAASRAEASDSPLWQDPLWQRALGIAERGIALAEEAQASLRAGDPAAYQAKGKEAKALIDEAITMTAEMEERLLEEPGESDPVVRLIKKERSAWFDKLRVLHKTTGR
jgi:hypothetical protein